MPAPISPLALDLSAMRCAAEEACRLMKVLSNSDRLLLLCQLAEGEKRVGELESLLGIVQPTLSQQLGVLRDEELVATRRDGKNIYYRICSPAALQVMQLLYALYCPAPTSAGHEVHPAETALTT
jgi:DNA-binding transcriptional ArsR family regulator